MKIPFKYLVLRYMHDIFTREFVNVAVLVFAPQASFLRFKPVDQFDRLHKFFPGVDLQSIRQILKFLGERFETLESQLGEELGDTQSTIVDLATRALPVDDLGLKWRGGGGGLCSEPEVALDELHQRLVSRHLIPKAPKGRDDGAVQDVFDAVFRNHGIMHRFHERTLKYGALTEKFPRAWAPPSGRVKVLRPLTFDLQEPSDIVAKAAGWAGRTNRLRKSEDEFDIFFLLGRPMGTRMMSDRLTAFREARDVLLDVVGNELQVIDETEAPVLASHLEQEMKTGSS